MKEFNIDNIARDENMVIKWCVNFLMNNGGSSIPDGKYFVEEDGIYLNVTEYTTRLLKDGKWEAHRKYFDFQIILEGEECIGISHINIMKTEAYDEDKDYLECSGESEQSIVLRKSEGVLLMPEDVHMPCLCIDENKAKVKKAVFKIPVNYFETEKVV